MVWGKWEEMEGWESKWICSQNTFYIHVQRINIFTITNSYIQRQNLLCESTMNSHRYTNVKERLKNLHFNKKSMEG